MGDNIKGRWGAGLFRGSCSDKRKKAVRGSKGNGNQANPKKEQPTAQNEGGVLNEKKKKESNKRGSIATHTLLRFPIRKERAFRVQAYWGG